MLDSILTNMDLCLEGQSMTIFAMHLLQIEYAKYSQQDVFILQVDIAKEFDTRQWDFISQVMSKMGFDPKIANVVYWLYSDSTA